MGWYGKNLLGNGVLEEVRLPTYQEVLKEKPYNAIMPSKTQMVKYLTVQGSVLAYQHMNWAIEYLGSDLEPVCKWSAVGAKYLYTMRLACAKYLEENYDGRGN